MMNKFFGTPKRAAISSVCITILALFAAGAVFTAIYIARISFSGKEITLEKAKEIALADAGLTDSEVVFAKTKQEMERGILVYEIEFYVDGIEYSFEIDALSGKVLEAEMENN